MANMFHRAFLVFALLSSVQALAGDMVDITDRSV
jgi:hypothetical protein